MGIKINVLWNGSLLPNALSRVIILSRIKKYYRGYAHPFWLIYSVALTAIVIVHTLVHVAHG